MVQSQALAFGFGLHHTRAEDDGVPSGCFSRVTLSVKAGQGHYQIEGMRHVDMRKLPAAAQEERRRQVVGLRQRGLTYREIAEQVGLSRTGVIDICQRFAVEGAKGLVSK